MPQKAAGNDKLAAANAAACRRSPKLACAPVSPCPLCSTRRTSLGITRALTTGRSSPSKRRTTPQACWRRAPSPRSSQSTAVRPYDQALHGTVHGARASGQPCVFRCRHEHHTVMTGGLASYVLPGPQAPSLLFLPGHVSSACLHPCREVPARGVASSDQGSQGARRGLRAQPGGGLHDGEGGVRACLRHVLPLS